MLFGISCVAGLKEFTYFETAPMTGSKQIVTGLKKGEIIYENQK
jgi:hypothetical protein